MIVDGCCDDNLIVAARGQGHAIPRTLYNVLGWTFVGLGILGYILPVMPGTVFMILALCCFKRGSEKFETWLLEHPRVGPVLRDWDRDRSIRPRTKVVAIAMIWVCIGGSLFVVHKAWVAWMLLAIAVGLTFYLATRKSSPSTSTVRV